MEQRYFIAIVPPVQIANEVLALKNEFAERFNSKAALRSPAHITLHMPFLWKEEKEQVLIDRFSNIAYTEAPSTIALNNFSRFGERVIFINVSAPPALNILQEQVVQLAKQKLQLFNQSEDLRGFHPHITVAFRDLRKRYFDEAWAEFKNRSFSAEFPQKDFSILKHDGVRWNVLHTIPLHGN